MKIKFLLKRVLFLLQLDSKDSLESDYIVHEICINLKLQSKKYLRMKVSVKI